jgi:hypothetical protein
MMNERELDDDSDHAEHEPSRRERATLADRHGPEP